MLPTHVFPVVASNSITTPPKPFISRCVSFLDDGRDILIGFLDSHEVYVGLESVVAEVDLSTCI